MNRRSSHPVPAALRATLQRGQAAFSPDLELAWPDVVAPSLDGLRLPALNVEPLDRGSLALAIEEALRLAAQVEHRAPGAAVQPGDEVLVDLVGYANNKVVPFSARGAAWLDERADTELPGLRTALVGATVGSARVVPVTRVVDNQPLTVSYAVDVRGARALHVPSPDAPDFLQAVGAASMDAFVERVGEQATQERLHAEVDDGKRAVLRAVGARLDVAVDAAIIDEAIRRRWRDGEGTLLRDKGTPLNELQESLVVWQAHEPLRDEVAASLRTTWALRALARKHDITLHDDEQHAALVRVAGLTGQAVHDVTKALAGDAAAHARFVDECILAKTIDWLFEQLVASSPH
jgi:trigger factor